MPRISNRHTLSESILIKANNSSISKKTERKLEAKIVAIKNSTSPEVFRFRIDPALHAISEIKCRKVADHIRAVIGRHTDNTCPIAGDASDNKADSANSSEENAAKIIQKFLRKTVAAQSYGHMFSNGTLFNTGDQSVLQQKSGGKYPINVLDYVKNVSKKNLESLRADVGSLLPKEDKLRKQISQTEIFLTHQSDHDLERRNEKTGKRILNISSNKLLASQGKFDNSHLSKRDRNFLANDDFVFFACVFSKNREIVPFNKKYQGNFYGKNVYIIDQSHPNFESGYFTLYDHCIGMPIHPDKNEHLSFSKKFEFLSKSKREIFNVLGKDNIPVRDIFSPGEIKEAISLHIIKYLRITKDPDLKKFALKPQLTQLELSSLINLLVQPEFHLPRSVCTDNYFSTITQK